MKAVADGVFERAFDEVEPEAGFGACLRRLKRCEIFEVTHRRVTAVGGGIALALNEEHRVLGSGEGAQIVEPIGQWAVMHGEAVFLVNLRVLELRRPQDKVDGTAPKKQGVGAVIDLLAAKVPEIELSGRSGVFEEKCGLTYLNPWVLSPGS